MEKESESSDVGVGIGQIEEGVGGDGATNGCTRSLKPPPPPPSSPSPSPTSQFEYDNGIDSTYQALAFDSLYKSYSNALMDEEETTSSEESVHLLNKRDDEESFSSLSSNAVSSTSNHIIHKNNKKEAEDTGFSEFIDNVFSFSPSCRLECGGFPGMVEDVDKNLSHDLHNLIIRGGGEEVGGLNILNDWILLNEQVEAGDKQEQEEGGVDEREDEEGGEKVIEGGQIHFKIAEDEEVFDEHGKGNDDDEEEALLLLENASNRCSPEVEATLALKKDEMLPTN